MPYISHAQINTTTLNASFSLLSNEHINKCEWLWNELNSSLARIHYGLYRKSKWQNLANLLTSLSIAENNQIYKLSNGHMIVQSEDRSVFQSNSCFSHRKLSSIIFIQTNMTFVSLICLSSCNKMDFETCYLQSDTWISQWQWKLSTRKTLRSK